MAEPMAPAQLLRMRDLRLDVLRGLCLVMIFINHVPGTGFERLTSRNFGFSDAAEGFVLMSGLAAGLAYSPGFAGGITWPAVARVWHRAWTLYLIHLLTTLLAIAVVAAGALWLGAGDMLLHNNFRPIFAAPLRVQIGIPLLTHQIGYANILPMYAVLLLAAPLALRLALTWPRSLLAGSVALWAAAGLLAINLPNYPNAGGWFFNPLSWQLIFTVGLLTGVAMRQNRRFLPVRGWAQWVTGGFLLLALVCTLFPVAAAAMGSVLWNLQDLGVPTLLTTFDKTYVSGPRLLHIMALAYFLSTLPQVRRVARSGFARPLALLGRHSLPVFATGTVLAYVAQVIKSVTVPDFGLDAALIGTGLGLHLLVAWLFDRGRIRKA